MPSRKLPGIKRDFKGAVHFANWIKRHAWTASLLVPVNVSEGSVWPALKNLVEKVHSRPVRLWPRADLVNISVLLPSKEAFNILIPQSFNYCHKRFAVAKELCHILTDDKSVVAHDPLTQLDSALETVKQVREAQHGNPSASSVKCPLFTAATLSSEDFCFLLALETLIPVNERDKMVCDAFVMGVRHFDLAVRLRIPESLVSYFLLSGYNFAFKRVGGIDC